TSEQRCSREENRGSTEERGIVRRNFKQLRREQTTKRKRGNQADRKSDHNRFHSLINDHTQDVERLSADGHADPDFAGALFNRVSDRAVNADAGEQQRHASKNSEQPRHQTRLTERLCDHRVHTLRNRDRQIRIHFAQRGLNELRDRISFQIAANVDVQEREVFLRPRPIKFHSRRVLDLGRPHIADDADDFTCDAETGDEQGFPDWIFVWINLLGAGLTDQTDLLPVGQVVLIEFTARQKRHAPRLEISGGNVVTRRVGALFDWRHITIAARIKRPVAAIQRDVAADGRALQTGHIAQSVERLFDETLTRWRVRILRNRQGDRASPKILRTKADVLLIQANETGDEQRSAGQECDRERDLRANQDFAEALLPHAAAAPASALFQSVNQIGMRSLKRGINSHQQAGQERQSDRERENRK